MLNIDYKTKKSMRVAFGEKLAELGEKNENIVSLDADLSCSTQSIIFAKKFPNRFFNVGIAEQNLINTALGLSLEGKIPFASTFSVFATGRAYDQIRNSVCYQNSNVKIIGTHAGITVGEDGGSHQALEDISLMRSIPNMMVIAPCDWEQTQQAVEFAANHNGPVYIRISRMNLPNIYSENYVFNPYIADVLKEGRDLTIFTYGDETIEVIKASEILEKNNINAEIVNIPVIKPLDINTIIKSVNKTKLAIVVENHSIIGGLGSAIAECLSENSPNKVVRIGMYDIFGQSGSSEDLLKFYKLDSESIAKKIIELIK